MKKIYLTMLAVFITTTLVASNGWPNTSTNNVFNLSAHTFDLYEHNMSECEYCDNYHLYIIHGISSKPNCTCGGYLELSFKAYKKYTGKKCTLCNGTGRKLDSRGNPTMENCSWCDNGKEFEWQTAYVCQRCGKLYSVEWVQSQM